MKALNNYINMKHINTYIVEKLKISKNKRTEYTLFPKYREELIDMITKEIQRNGNECSLNHIDVSKITDMNFVFSDDEWNPDISEWDVSNVKNMRCMFYNNSVFNGDLSNWDVSNVENMCDMFFNTYFNNDSICDWDVSNVKYMNGMFDHAAFNYSLNNWDVSNVREMSQMFYEASYDKPLNN